MKNDKCKLNFFTVSNKARSVTLVEKSDGKICEITKELNISPNTFLSITKDKILILDNGNMNKTRTALYFDIDY